MRFLKKKARVLLVGTLVITALLLVGLMMVPQQGKKIGIPSCSAGLKECRCPDGYNDSDGKHPSGECGYRYDERYHGCYTYKKCWNHYYDGRTYNWFDASCDEFDVK